MISYREKQLLMVMKMLQDETTELNEEMTAALLATENKTPYTHNITCMQCSAEKYEDLIDIAETRGYNLHLRASDILSPEELADIEARKEAIERQFEDLVKLQKIDYAFLFSAVAMLIAKQIILKLDLSKREADAEEAEKKFKEKYNSPKDVDGKEKAKRYYAPTQQITKTKTVPFDFVANTKYFNHGERETGLGLDGDNHRFKSVGHDPLLGLAFGTANILTNTATFYVDKKIMANFHVKYQDMYKYTQPYIYSFASTNLMFEKVWKRAKADPKALWLAFVKEIEHIQSDMKSVAGIPLPFLAYILGDDKARELALEGMDLNTFLINAKIVGGQAFIEVLVNLLISWLHRLYLLWTDVKDAESVLEAATTYLTAEINSFDKIRTKKIVMYADAIASTVNIGVCVGGGIISGKLGKPDIAKTLLSHTDIGGLMVTIATLFKEEKYILKVKDDFIKEAINLDFKQRLEEIEHEKVSLSIL